MIAHRARRRVGKRRLGAGFFAICRTSCRARFEGQLPLMCRRLDPRFKTPCAKSGDRKGRRPWPSSGWVGGMGHLGVQYGPRKMGFSQRRPSPAGQGQPRSRSPRAGLAGASVYIGNSQGPRGTRGGESSSWGGCEDLILRDSHHLGRRRMKCWSRGGVGSNGTLGSFVGGGRVDFAGVFPWRCSRAAVRSTGLVFRGPSITRQDKRFAFQHCGDRGVGD